MIYTVIAVNPTTHDEWVMSTHDTWKEAADQADKYREHDNRFTYRIDQVETSNIVRSNLSELAKSRDWKVGDDNDPPASLHTRRLFTALELFPPKGSWTTSDCAECGAYVRIQQQNLHAEWHNKVADL